MPRGEAHKISANTQPQLTEIDAERMIQMRRGRLTLDEIGRIYGVTLRTHVPAAEPAVLDGWDQR